MIPKPQSVHRHDYAQCVATWKNLVLIVIGVTLVRLFYAGVLNPVELVKDEAHYWEWSRHLAGSYYTKGPGVAWLIAGSVHVFGVSEWGVRLPAMLLSALTALAIAKLTSDVSHGDQRAGFFAGVAFLLVPAYQVTGMLMTIDGPYMFCWVMVVWIMFHALAKHKSGNWSWQYLWVGFFLGLGFLFKYTTLLLLPGLVVYFWLLRRSLQWSAITWLNLFAGLLVMG